MNVNHISYRFNYYLGLVVYLTLQHSVKLAQLATAAAATAAALLHLDPTPV